jgi:tRNA-splicing ligase RtcB
MEITRVGAATYRIEPEGAMRVPGIVYGDEQLFASEDQREALQQVCNVATLPGIVKASIAMPDIHWGYGFPIGGVAAISDDGDGVVSPGGVGFDINCGVRLIRSEVGADEAATRVEPLLQEISRRVPTGTNRYGALTVSARDLPDVLERGVPWLAQRGLATHEDLDRIEERGALPGARAGAVSAHAVERGRTQLGSLGAGNHFLELQRVDEVFDAAAAKAFGVFAGQLVVMIHSGSRGLGHQVCTDHVQRMAAGLARWGFEVPDRQLACAPLTSTEGQDYLAAMACAANFAFVNRSVMTHEVRGAFAQVFGRPRERLGLEVVYDVAHNIVKREQHEVDGVLRALWVHRKGATRAFGPGRPELPEVYRESGQPVIIPGDMGTASWLLAGTQVAMQESFGSACHGAGRRLSRGAAKRLKSGAEVRRELEAQGIVVRAGTTALLAEEAPYAYKDVDAVVAVVAAAGLARRVARLKPLGVLKG